MEVHSLNDKTSDIIVNAIVNSVKKFNIKKKIICLRGDKLTQILMKDRILLETIFLLIRNHICHIVVVFHVYNNYICKSCGILPKRSDSHQIFKTSIIWSN